VPFLVHGVSRDLASPPSGADEPDYGTVTDGPLVGIVSPTDAEEALPTRASLLHHTSVLEHVGRRGTVVPMRFGVIVPDEEALIADFLRPERDRLLATLDRLDGHVELRLRGRYDEAEVIQDVLESDPRAARLRGRRGTDDKMELGERIVAGIDRRRVRDTEHAVAALRPHAAGVTRADTSQPLDAFTLSFLVAEDGRSAFEAALDRLGEEFDPLLRLELIGPVPPFSFAAEAEDAWA
jgi:hypothetical protein